MAKKSIAWEFLEAIEKKLSEGDKRRMDREIDRLNAINSEVKGQTHYGFTYRGERFIATRYRHMTRELARVPLPTLPIAFMDDAAALLRDREQLKADMQKIRQGLSTPLINCVSEQDYRDVLPDCLVHLFPNLAKIPRVLSGPEAIIRSDKFAIKAFADVLPLIEAYSVTSMLM